MRKSLVLTLLLLALAASSLGYAHGWVDQRKDAVIIDETVLYGDRSVADGIALGCRVQSDYRLFWDTRYTIGAAPQISTDFTFSQVEQLPTSISRSSGVYFGTFGGYGSGSSGGLNMADEPAPNQDVASRTQPGEKHTETVYLKDYYDFYPIHVYFDRPSRFADNADTQQLFADYFRIPVHPQDSVEITVEKDSAGNVRSLGVSSIQGNGIYIDTGSVVIEDLCFFTLSCSSSDGVLLDTSHIPGGYGIYRFPLHNQEGDDRTLTADELQTVFAIDAGRARVVTLQVTADNSKLLLVTIEGGRYLLTVIDAATMAQLQRLELLTVEGDTGLGSFYVYDDFVVPVLGDGRFALLTPTVDGRYEVQFTGDFGEIEELRYAFSRVASMDYNGERLAVAAFQDGRSDPQSFCSVYLAVYGDAGLAYAGEYRHSLDRSLVDHSLACRPADEAPTVTWGDWTGR